MTSEPKKYHISTSQSTGIGSAHGSQIDCNDLAEFVEKLKINRIAKCSLKYFTPYDDVSSFQENNLTPESITQAHFNWLTEPSRGGLRFLEIECISKDPYVPGTVLHHRLMPYTDKQLEQYFNESSASKHIQYFSNSIGKYKNYEINKDKISPSDFKEFRQAEKDERFFTTRAFVGLFEDPQKVANLKTLLIKAFGDVPPFDKQSLYSNSWDSLLRNDLELRLEKDFPAPQRYLQHLETSLHKRHFVPYVIEKGRGKKDGSYRSDLEGPTQVDAWIRTKEHNPLEIFIEAKYLSDISCDVSYDVTRNQLARTIDIMLERCRDRGLVLLVTPKYFKDHPESRLYGYKMREYVSNHLTLMADLHHRHEIEPCEWKSIAGRIGWITWEDIHQLGIK